MLDSRDWLGYSLEQCISSEIYDYALEVLEQLAKYHDTISTLQSGPQTVSPIPA